MQHEMSMSNEALIAYIAGRLEAVLTYTGKDNAMSSLSCDLKMFRMECDKLCDMCFQQLEKGNDKNNM